MKSNLQTLFTVLVAAAAVAAAMLPPAFAQAPAAQLQPAGSEIRFVTRQMGVPVEGRFGKFSAEIALDAQAANGGRVRLDIDTGSARFGTAELDAEVPKPTWLDVARFPRATFESSRIRSLGDGRYEVAGQLSLKGQQQPVIVPVTLTRSGAGAGVASGSFTLKRLQFRVGEGDWADTSLLADDITVSFKLALTGLPAR